MRDRSRRKARASVAKRWIVERSSTGARLAVVAAPLNVRQRRGWRLLRQSRTRRLPHRLLTARRLRRRRWLQCLRRLMRCLCRPMMLRPLLPSHLYSRQSRSNYSSSSWRNCSRRVRIRVARRVGAGIRRAVGRRVGTRIVRRIGTRVGRAVARDDDRTVASAGHRSRRALDVRGRRILPCLRRGAGERRHPGDQRRFEFPLSCHGRYFFFRPDRHLRSGGAIERAGSDVSVHCNPFLGCHWRNTGLMEPCAS